MAMLATIVALLLGGCVVGCTAAVYTPPAALNFSIWTGANESCFQYPETASLPSSTSSNSSALPGTNATTNTANTTAGSNTSSYAIPMLLSKPNLGIALSGGGFRAATLGLGWLRALSSLNITASARYLASNSGGSWLNAAFSFQDKVALDTFLGPYIPPQQLSTQQLGVNSTPGSFEGVITNAGILVPGAIGAVLDAVRSLLPGEQQGVGAWSSTVGEAFLEPYGLNSDASTFTAAGTAGPVHQAAADLPESVQVYTYRPAGNYSRPFPIMMGAVLLQNTSLGFYPFEFTPLYVGCPPFFNDTTPPIGGGFTDPLGLNTPAPDPKPTIPAPILASFAATDVTGFDNGTLLTNETASNVTNSGNDSQLSGLLPLSTSSQPAFIVPLKMVMGISSSFITNQFTPGGTFSRELTGTEVLRYWSPINFTDQQVPFADGGSADNTAITPLLRRRVTKIIACVAASQNISGSTPDDWAGYQWDIAGLFGANPPTHPEYDEGNTIVGVPVDLYNRKMQVFPREAWTQLINALQNSTAAGGPTYHLATYTVMTNPFQAIFGGWQNSTAAGGPTYHLATYTVMTNPFQAIFGGWQVDVLWVINQQQHSWESGLPQEVAAALAQSRGQEEGGLLGDIAQGISEVFSTGGSGGSLQGLEGFPFIDTGKADYSPGLTTLLSQQATWQMLQLQPQLQQLLSRTNFEGHQLPATRALQQGAGSDTSSSESPNTSTSGAARHASYTVLALLGTVVSIWGGYTSALAL